MPDLVGVQPNLVGVEAKPMADSRGQLPPLLVAKYGSWKEHDYPAPGVIRHRAGDGTECWSLRLALPPGGMLSADTLRLLAGWIRRFAAVGRRTSRQGFELVGVDPSRLPDLIEEVRWAGFVVGGTGPRMRQVKACGGYLHCQNAVIDSSGLAGELGQRLAARFTDTRLPAPLRIAVAGCPNDCGGGHGADLGLVGTYSGYPRLRGVGIPEREVRALSAWCPVGAIRLRNTGAAMSLEIQRERCVRCLSCLTVSPDWIEMEGQKGVAVYVGARAGLSPRLGRLAREFLPWRSAEAREILEAVIEIVDKWCGGARPGQRLGDWWWGEP